MDASKNVSLSEMAAQYSAAATEKNSAWNKLDKQAQDRVKTLQANIKQARKDESDAIAMVTVDAANEKLTPSQALALKKTINGDYTAKIGQMEAEIISIYPSFALTAQVVVEQGIVKAGDKTGKALGNLLHAPVQGLFSFGKNFKAAATKTIDTGKHGLLS